MTSQAFAAEMRKLDSRYRTDAETKHIEMDMLMCRVLSQEGFIEGVRVFEDAERWYAH